MSDVKISKFPGRRRLSISRVVSCFSSEAACKISDGSDKGNKLQLRVRILGENLHATDSRSGSPSYSFGCFQSLNPYVAALIGSEDPFMGLDYFKCRQIS